MIYRLQDIVNSLGAINFTTWLHSTYIDYCLESILPIPIGNHIIICEENAIQLDLNDNIIQIHLETATIESECPDNVFRISKKLYLLEKNVNSRLNLKVYIDDK